MALTIQWSGFRNHSCMSYQPLKWELSCWYCLYHAKLIGRVPIHRKCKNSWEMFLSGLRMELLSHLINLICWYLRPLVKWFLRQTTRLCELQRICYGESSGAPRTIGVENSLLMSRVPEIQKLLKSMDTKVKKNLSLEDVKSVLDSSCSQIMKIKEIKPDLHRQFVQSMTVCLRQIWGYKQLVLNIENLRAEAFDDGNLQHEMQLLELWTLLQPDRPLLTRVTKQWQDIGFQGEDPKTDFRGMGILGLQNLV